MLKLISGLSLFGLLLSMGVVNTASAQIVDTVVVDAPFSFVVDGTTLPAGKYDIRPADDVEAGDNLMEIVSADGRTEVLFMTDASTVKTEPEHSVVLFNNYEGHRYLSAVYLAGDTTGITLIPGYREKIYLKHGKKATVESRPAKKK